MKPTKFTKMARIGIIVLIAGLLISIGIAIAFYIEFQPNFIYVNAGEPIQVGPVIYIIEPIGIHEGNEKKQPEHVFFQIQITAENLGKEATRMTGGQFYILNENDDKFQPVYGNFSKNDLLNDLLLPNEPASYTTQFDILYDENKQYRIGVLPTKQQASMDIGIICLINC